MIYKIIKGKTNIRSYSNYIQITTDNTQNIFTPEGQKKIIYDNFVNDKIIKKIKISTDSLNKLFECIINNSKDNIRNILIEENISLLPMGLSIVYQNIEYYKVINNISSSDGIVIDSDINNINCILQISKDINIPVTINGSNISLEEYYNILDDYDINKFSNKNIKVYYQECNNVVDIQMLYEISRQINYISKKIKRYNLSSLEQVFLIFDIVKNNIYNKENIGENTNLSRTLDNVLNNEYIVCAGYIAIMNAILKSLGFNIQRLSCNNGKHCRTAIYIKDDKYNLDGVYIFDPTFDKKKNEDDNYIDNYEFFALPYNTADKSSKSNLFDVLDLSVVQLKELLNNLINNNTIMYINVSSRLDSLFKLVNNDNYDYFIDGLLLYDKLSCEEQKKLELIFEDLKSKYRVSNMEVNTFMTALYSTRRIEYYLSSELNDNKYSSRLIVPKVDELSLLDVKISTIKRYYNIARYSENIDNSLMLQIYMINLENYIDNNINNAVNMFLNEGNINRDIFNIKLLRLLKNKIRD